MGAVGIPVQNLSSQGIAGMSLNAAKSLPNAEAFAKGLTIPGDSTGAVQAEFATAVRDGAFAVNLVNTKIPTAFKQQEVPKPASDTVGRATVDAATTRVIGDDKVPAPSYTPKPVSDNTEDVVAYVNTAKTLAVDYINPANIALTAIGNKLTALEGQQTITQQQYDAINNEYQQARNTFNAKGPELIAILESAFARLGTKQQELLYTSDKFTNIINIRAAKSILLDKNKSIKEKLAALSLKIEGRGAGE
jgi:membrane-bound inhibitor of C-type lysozyme